MQQTRNEARVTWNVTWKEADLHSSITASLFAPFTGTSRSSTTWVSRNTHRSGLLGNTATLARTPGIPRPQTVNRTTLRVAWNSPISLRAARLRARLAKAPWIRSNIPSLCQRSTTTSFGTASECGPVIKNTALPWVPWATRRISVSSAASSSRPRLRKPNQSKQSGRGQEKDQKEVLQLITSQTEVERSTKSSNLPLMTEPGTYVLPWLNKPQQIWDDNVKL